jgi:hypothetical protein
MTRAHPGLVNLKQSPLLRIYAHTAFQKVRETSTDASSSFPLSFYVSCKPGQSFLCLFDTSGEIFQRRPRAGSKGTHPEERFPQRAAEVLQEKRKKDWEMLRCSGNEFFSKRVHGGDCQWHRPPGFHLDGPCLPMSASCSPNTHHPLCAGRSSQGATGCCQVQCWKTQVLSQP